MEKKAFNQIHSDDNRYQKQVEDFENKMMNKNMKKRKIGTILKGSILLCILAIFFSTIFALIKMNSNKITEGIFLQGVEVSGLTSQEAFLKIETQIQEKLKEDIKLKHNEYNTTIATESLGIEYNIKKAIEEAYLIGRTDNIFVNNYQILGALIKNKDIKIDIKINSEMLSQQIKDLQVRLPDALIKTTYRVEGEELVITKGTEGVVIEEEKFRTKISGKIQNIIEKEIEFKIPVKLVKPGEISIDEIYNEIACEPKNAYVEKNPFKIYKEIDGIDFDINKAKEIVKNEFKNEYKISLNKKKAAVTINDLGEDVFPNVLSKYDTRYDASNKDRENNLELASNKINQAVILPGETFSYNKVVGPRTEDNGFKEAAVYQNGEVVNGLGGGICQISSTLYNAVLMANLEIVERKNHQFVTSYVPIGRDATVAYGLIDFKFKNTREYPIKISAKVVSGVVSISIEGISQKNEYTELFSYNIIKRLPYETQYKEDYTLEKGKEYVKQTGAEGQIIQTYITNSLNEKVLLSTDTYQPMPRIIVKGMK